MTPVRLLVLGCALSACGLRTFYPDGGESGGGSATGGGSTATGGGTTGTGGSGTGGGSAGGTAGGSAGGSAGGAPVAFQYAGIAVPALGGSYISGISGRTGEVYAVTDANEMFRSTGGAFVSIANITLSQGRGVYVASDGSVFPVGQRQLGSCRTACNLAASYTFQTVANDLNVYAVCGVSATDVYAVLEDNSYMARLWHWDGTSWTSAANNLGVKQPRACVVTSSGTVVVAGQKNVVFYSNGITTPEVPGTVPPLTQNTSDFAQWYGVGVAGGKVIAVGDFRRISVRTAPNTWALTETPSATATLFAVGGISENEIFAGGGAQSGQQLMFFNGSTWALRPALPTVTGIRAIYVAGPNEVFFGGGDGSDPLVDKAFR